MDVNSSCKGLGRRDSLWRCCDETRVQQGFLLLVGIAFPSVIFQASFPEESFVPRYSFGDLLHVLKCHLCTKSERESKQEPRVTSWVGNVQ